MIVLDTNIVAALMANGADIDPWLATVPLYELCTTVMTRAEIRYGLSRLPASKRRSRLTAEPMLVQRDPGATPAFRRHGSGSLR
jgi:predicted nucleic acid-binding protein